MKFLSTTRVKDLKGKVALLRLDFNTEDNWRMEASMPTIRFLLKRCTSVVILSHKGRPAGFEKSLSLRPMANALARKLGSRVIFMPQFHFQEMGELIRSSPKGSVFLLENLRFLPGEEENSAALAEHLAMLGDIYVNDAFAVSHRANASVVAVTGFLPSYAGLGLESEIKNLSRVMKNPKEPLTVILGGLKIKDKMSVVANLKKKTASFLIGGALTPEMLVLKFWDPKLTLKKLLTPVDFKLDGGAIRDIGPESIKLFTHEITAAKTIIWNGPLGNILDTRFRNGTREIARAVARNKQAFTVVGGGETVMFLKKMKLDRKIGFISTGGGAMLDFLAGKELPGIRALESRSSYLKS